MVDKAQRREIPELVEEEEEEEKEEEDCVEGRNDWEIE